MFPCQVKYSSYTFSFETLASFFRVLKFSRFLICFLILVHTLFKTELLSKET